MRASNNRRILAHPENLNASHHLFCYDIFSRLICCKDSTNLNIYQFGLEEMEKRERHTLYTAIDVGEGRGVPISALLLLARLERLILI